MRIDDAILSGSVVGSSATVSLTGSFTGSGHITLADSSSYAVTASYAVTSSHTEFADSSSYSVTASYAVTSSHTEFADSSSYSVTSSYAITSSHALDIQNKIVDYATLGGEFTSSVALGTVDINIDFDAGSIFFKENGGTDTLTFLNVKTGDVKTIVAVSGSSISLPASCTTLSNQGTYDGTKKNIISIIAVSPGEQFNTINITP